MDRELLAVESRDLNRLLDDLGFLGWSVREDGEGRSLTPRAGEVVRTRLDELRSVMAHDIASPARALKLIAELVQRDPEGVDTKLIEAIPEQAEQVMRLSLRLAEYLRVVLTRPEPSSVGLRALVEEAVFDVRARGDLRIDIDDALVIHVDESLVSASVREIVGNAVTYSTASVEIAGSADAAGAELTVTDHGPGIDAAYHDVIFDLGRRLHTFGEVPGTGVGLAICKLVAEMHHGTISVSSEPGRGCRFTSYFPAGEPADVGTGR